ncbi:MAG: response regulator [Bacteroidales bacterium]|nr:response regulator [Bacteroidales bacterium]
MMSKSNNESKNIKHKSIKENIFLTVSSLADYLFIYDTNGNYIDIRFPENHNIIDINPEKSLKKHYKEIFISNDFERNFEKHLTKLKETTINQEFEFTTSKKNDTYYLNAKISELKSEKGEALGYVLLAYDITNFRLNENKLNNRINEYENKISLMEKDINFYIKQGDVTTNQRAKIQKDRDRLAVEKSDIAKQKERMEEDLNFIMKQGDKIAEQKHKIIIQHKIVRKQNKKIEDSILYAKRIQSAVLPPNRFIQHLLAEHFIFYKPRDIVSGDFYWTKQVDDKIYIAAADCTGHGVPGALMSMLGITFLNEIINKNPNIHANEILNELRIHIISSLRQTGSTGESRDGLDIALCIINHKNKSLEYSGANNPLYLIRNNALIETKPDRMPIGIHRRAKESFQNNILKLQNNDLVYIFSDGFVDQFGGKDGRKFLSSNFKNLLIENNSKSLNEQKILIEQTFNNWKGERKQLDDILIIGFKIAFDKKEIKSKLNYDWTEKTILIAEDDEANFLLLRKSLEKTNADIIHAENGKDAVKLFRTNPDIDIVLMDIRMPIMDGIEATTQIKQIDKNIPIIVQTAFTMSSEKEKSFKAGCDDYISKPINIKELYATICKYLEKQSE